MSGKVLLGLAASAAIGLGVSAMPAQADNDYNYHPPKNHKPYEVTEGWIYKKYCTATVEDAKKYTVTGPAYLHFILKEKRDRHDYDNDKNYKYDDKHKPKHKSYKLTIICKFKPNDPVYVHKVKDSEDFACHQYVARKFDQDTYDSYASIDVEKVRIKWRYFNVIKKVLLKCTFDEKHKYPYPPKY